MESGRKSLWRGVALLAIAGVAAAALSVSPATAAKVFTKSKARQLFFTKAQAEDLFVQRHWAVVEANGTLLRQAGAVSARKDSTGTYSIVFSRDIATCAWLASLDAPGGEIRAYLGGTGSTLGVETYDSAGTKADRKFHAVVLC